MDPDPDHARVLLDHFDQWYNAVGNHHIAYDQTIQVFPDFHQEVDARSGWVGVVPPIQVGEDFQFRYKLMLAGLHNHQFEGFTAMGVVMRCVV